MEDVFTNGVFEDASVCFQHCKGQCCSQIGENGKHDPSLPWHVPTMVWDESIHYTDPENKAEDPQTITCLRKGKRNCSNKPVVCKIHPYYPARISIRLEDCDFGISLSTKRSHCAQIRVTDAFLQKLSDFFLWLYSDLDNRVAYMGDEVSAAETAEEAAQIFHEGAVIGDKIWERKN